MGGQSMSNFITDCINGDALTSDVDNYIEMWHKGDGEMPLYAFLGMSKREYNLFIQDETYLAWIISAHMEGKVIEDFVKNHIAMVARSDSHAKSERLQRWLQQEDLWD